MTARTVTTNPAGYTVSRWDDHLTADQIVVLYREFYERIDVIHDKKSTPEGVYLKCFKVREKSDEFELYQVRWD